MAETLPMLGICNLCLDEGAVKSMIIPHQYNGNSEVYSVMLMECFSIELSSQKLVDAKPLICDGCIDKLRGSMIFKHQALNSLKCLEVAEKNDEELMLLTEEVKIEEKSELLEYLDDDVLINVGTETDTVQEVQKEDSKLVEYLDDDVLIDDDTETHTDVYKSVIETEKKEETTRKTRSTTLASKKRTIKKKKNVTKITKSPLKKTDDLTETEAMLDSGLFPFKINKNRTFSCLICPENFTNLDDMKSHIIDHTKVNINLAFKKMTFSNSHRFYKNDTKLKCTKCTTDLSNYDELKQHIEDCTITKFVELKRSLPFKLKKDQLDCPVCKKKFLNYVNLNTHMNVHYPNYECDDCGKVFASSERLRGHRRSHEVGDFPCRYCEKVFDRVTKRDNHISKQHKPDDRYACKHCNITLISFNARQKHLAEVHNEDLKKYKCKECPQSYTSPGLLSSHVTRDHPTERNHKCEKCGSAFYTKNALKMHMIRHDGERRYICPVCYKTYPRKYTLMEHLRIHNNEKRFLCPECGKAFTQKTTLKTHLKIHERNATPFINPPSIH